MNLNWLEARKTIEILDKLKPDKAIIDCPSPNIKAYTNYIKSYLRKKDIELIVEHKADVNHVIVSAASILAKVTRDRSIEKIKKEYGDCGPGYQSNPITQKFIKENFDKYPEIFRKSWMTFKNQVSEKEQKKLGEY